MLKISLFSGPGPLPISLVMVTASADIPFSPYKLLSAC